VELAAFSMAVALIIGIGVGVLSASTRHDFRYGRKAVWNYYLCASIFGRDAHAVNFAVQLRWFPLGSRFPASLPPPSGPTGLYTIDSLLSGNLDQFSRRSTISRFSFTLGLLSGIFERIVRISSKHFGLIMWKQLALEAFKRQILLAHAFKNAIQ